MGWDAADQAATGDWIRWADAPFDVVFLSAPEVQTKEFRGKQSTQIIFTVRTRDGDKKLGLSKLAYQELRPLVRELGDGFAKTAIRCHRFGEGYNVKYEFQTLTSDQAKSAPPPSAEPPPAPEPDPFGNVAPDDDLPF